MASTEAENVIDLTESPAKLAAKPESAEGEDPATSSSSNIPQIAKERLSKWAARLFDPDRPKGVIQPPQTIPLNDEFLQAFGRREQETDAKLGVALEIDRAIPDEDDKEVATTAEPTSNKKSKQGDTDKASRKVKITNLRFTMPESGLQNACKRFGPIESVQIIKNPSDPSKHLGFGYVTFQDAASAKKCMDKLSVIQERRVNVTVARSAPKRPKSTSSNASRYYNNKEEDLSTVCYHCGKIGHMARECENPKQTKPCTLCGFTAHDTRACPLKIICFKCGLPGHTIRDCNSGVSVPPELCTNCYRLGHHKRGCRGRADRRNAKDAVCMTCGNKGHFSCRRVSFFYGLKGLCCCNCGAVGHSLQECREPTFAECDRNRASNPMPSNSGEWTAAQAQDVIMRMNMQPPAPQRGRQEQHHRPNPPGRNGNQKRRRMR